MSKEQLPWQLSDEQIVRNAIGSTLYVRKHDARKALKRILKRLEKAER